HWSAQHLPVEPVRLNEGRSSVVAYRLHRSRALRSKTGTAHRRAAIGEDVPTCAVSVRPRSAALVCCATERRTRMSESSVYESEAVIDNGSFGKRSVRFETGRL